MHSCLITGATGTIGQALVRKLLADREDCRRIVIFSRDEHKQHEMRLSIADPEKRLRYFLGDVRDYVRLRRALEGIDCVIHAAALKHVEATEFNPFEAVKTNVLGAQNIIEAALDCGARKVLAISTDKAENPTTLYGATKLCAERIFLAANAYAGAKRTRFSVIRLGNIAFSRGSVIPKWRTLVANGKRAVPVTNPACTRYWLSAQDAAMCVLAFLDAMVGNECMFPGWMKAFSVGDLAKAMNVKMEITGLGAGERLHEQGSDSAPRMTVEELREALK